MTWDWDKLKERQRSQGSSGGGPPPPDFEEIKKKLRKFKNMGASGIVLAIVAVVLLWLATGIYIVGPKEVGVVQRFGEYTRMTQPGPHYHFPYPIETVQKPKVTEIKRIEIGFRTPDSVTTYEESKAKSIPKEAMMLTKGENFVDVKFIVQYMIKNAKNYLFNISKPKKTVKGASEAAMRDVIGNNLIDAALTEKKMEIQQTTKILLQEILDKYGSGIKVTAVNLQDVHPPQEVRNAFKDVASAREDKNTYGNRAKSFRNDILPKARGKVASILNDARAYKESKVLKAKGESQRFLELWEEYKNAPDVTKKRLYLESMQEILEGSDNKFIFSGSAGEKMVPYLPLDKLQSSGKKLEAESLKQENKTEKR